MFLPPFPDIQQQAARMAKLFEQYGRPNSEAFPVSNDRTVAICVIPTSGGGAKIEFALKAPWGTTTERTRYMHAEDATVPDKLARRIVTAWRDALAINRNHEAVGCVYTLAETKQIPEGWPECEPCFVDGWPDNDEYTVDGHPIDYDSMQYGDVGYWLARLAEFANKPKENSDGAEHGPR